MDPYKSMESDGVHPGILTELADVIAKLLMMTFGQSWEPRDVPTNWKLVNLPVFKKVRRRSPETTALLVSL